jgi:hypothetical protein
MALANRGRRDREAETGIRAGDEEGFLWHGRRCPVDRSMPLTDNTQKLRHRLLKL